MVRSKTGQIQKGPLNKPILNNSFFKTMATNLPVLSILKRLDPPYPPPPPVRVALIKAHCINSSSRNNGGTVTYKSFVCALLIVFGNTSRSTNHFTLPRDSTAQETETRKWAEETPSVPHAAVLMTTSQPQ